MFCKSYAKSASVNSKFPSLRFSGGNTPFESYNPNSPQASPVNSLNADLRAHCLGKSHLFFIILLLFCKIYVSLQFEIMIIMRRKLILFTILLVLVCIGNQSFAQLQVVAGGSASMPANWNADSLVRNILVGTGVEVSNVQFNGTSSIGCASIGKFTTGTNPTNLGLTSGIIMGTGGVTLAAGANSQGGGSQTGCTSYNPTNNPLSPLAGNNSINDCAILEFDFIPKSDSIKFRYVFGSEEYPEFVCSSYNDIFGFFITGINPNNLGQPYNNTNIALIPNTTLPISINNVNGGTSAGSATPCNLNYTAYYVNNTGGTTIQYDGFTTVLTAEAKVIPCYTYHLKLCIADLGDGAYDSGVFLEANSLTSNAIVPTFNNPSNPTAPNEVYEGCCVNMTLRRPHTRSTSTQINVSVGGTATNGTDFQQLNPSFYFPANTDSIVLQICPDIDSVTEGDETVMFVLTPADGCSDTINFIIKDADPLLMHAERSELTSASTFADLFAVIQGGMPHPDVSWTNRLSHQTRTGDSVRVSTVARTNRLLSPREIPGAWYDLVVEDLCFHAQDSAFVGVLRKFATESPDTLICAGMPLTLGVRGADSCVWRKDALTAHPFNTIDDTVTITPTASASYIVSSYAYWAGQWWEDIDTILVNVVPTPEMDVTASKIEVCPGDAVTLTGTGVSSYSWDEGVTFGSSASHTFNPDTTTMYYVYGKTAAGGCPSMDSILITVDYIPTITITGGNGICGGEAITLSVETDGTSFNWSASPSDPSMGEQNHNATITVNPSQTTLYTVVSYHGVCSNTASHSVAVERAPVGIGEANPQTVSLGQMQTTFSDISTNTSSRLWVFPDGTTSNQQSFSYIVPDDIDSMTVQLIAYNPYLCSDSTSVTVYVDHSTLWVPNAFTPDESTNNIFEVKMNDIKNYRIYIYNRAGLLVFMSTDPTKPWDGNDQNGQKCIQGAYTYLISINKTKPPCAQQVYTGTVMLIR